MYLFKLMLTHSLVPVFGLRVHSCLNDVTQFVGYPVSETYTCVYVYLRVGCQSHDVNLIASASARSARK